MDYDDEDEEARGNRASKGFKTWITKVCAPLSIAIEDGDTARIRTMMGYLERLLGPDVAWEVGTGLDTRFFMHLEPLDWRVRSMVEQVVDENFFSFKWDFRFGLPPMDERDPDAAVWSSHRIFRYRDFGWRYRLTSPGEPLFDLEIDAPPLLKLPPEKQTSTLNELIFYVLGEYLANHVNDRRLVTAEPDAEGFCDLNDLPPHARAYLDGCFKR